MKDRKNALSGSDSDAPSFFKLDVWPGRETVGIDVDGSGGFEPRPFSVLVNIIPKPVVTKDTRDLDACVILDVSGSMGFPATPFDIDRAAGNTKATVTGEINVEALQRAFEQHRANTKLAVCQWALGSVMEGFVPSDRAALITFSDHPSIICSHEQMDATAIEDFNTRLKALRPQHGTRFTEATEAALQYFEGSTRDDEQVIILFTDGQSSGGRMKKEEDQRNMLRLARQMRERGIRLLVYATGEEYDKDFLDELAATAGDGSYMYHAQTPAQMPAHLQAAINDARGAAINNLRLEVTTFKRNPHVRILEAWQCMPVLKRLKLTERGDLLVTDGVLSISRGQQVWLRMEITNPQPGTQNVFDYSVSATRASTGQETRFENFFTLKMSAQGQTPGKKEVTIMEGFIEAEKAARQGKLDHAAWWFRQIGRPELADEMDKLHEIMQRGGAGVEDAHRTATTVCGFGAQVSHYTMVAGMSEEG